MGYCLLNNPEMIRRLKSTEGETDFRMIFDEFFPKMRFYANEYLHDIDDANDIVQSVFTTLWEKRCLLDDDTNIFNYLLSLTKNKCIDYIRKLQSKEKYIRYTQSLYEDKLSFYGPDHSTDEMNTEEIEKQVKQLINMLPPSCRETFLLSRAYGLKYEEIASKLQISVKTVEKHITISLRHMRKNSRAFL